MRTFLKVLILSASAALCGCEMMGPLPDKVEDMDCGLLLKLADYQADHKITPFFLSQLAYPGDWRRIETGNENDFYWIKADSLKRMKNGKTEVYQATGLNVFSDSLTQNLVKIQIPADSCKTPSQTGKVRFMNFNQDHPAPFNYQKDFDLKGQTYIDKLARVVCGYQPMPEASKTELMAQKWRTCVDSCTPAPAK